MMWIFHRGCALLAAIAVLAAVQCSQTCAFGDCAQISSYNERKSDASECHQHSGKSSKSKKDTSNPCSHDVQSDKIERAIDKSARIAPSYHKLPLDAGWTNFVALFQPQYSAFPNLKAIPPLMDPVTLLTTILRV